jgi:hypothetical protein
LVPVAVSLPFPHPTATAANTTTVNTATTEHPTERPIVHSRPAPKSGK